MPSTQAIMHRPFFLTAPLSRFRFAGILMLVVSLAGCDILGTAVDERAPRVTLDRPFEGSVVSGQHLLVVVSTRTLGDDNWISFVNVMLNGMQVGEATLEDGVYRFRLNTTEFADGAYRLEAVAYDRNQARGISTPILITIQNTSSRPAPSLRIVDPTGNKAVAGTVRIVAQRQTAHDLSTEPITRVDWLIDGIVAHSSYNNPADGVSYVFDWDTAAEMAGRRVLQVKAHVLNDVFSVSEAVEIVLDNDPDGGDPAGGPGDLISRTAGIKGPITASSAVGFNNYVYVPTSWTDGITGQEIGRITAFNDVGLLAWTFDARGPVRQAPVIGNNEDVYVVSEDGRLYALSPLSGSLIWFYEPTVGGFSNPTAPALGVDGILWFGDGHGYLHAVNTFNGRPVDGYPIHITGSTSVAISAPPVITPDRVVIVGDTSGLLWIVDPVTGNHDCVDLGSPIHKPMAVIEVTYTIPVPGQVAQQVKSDVVYGVLENGSIFRSDLLDPANFSVTARPSDPIEYPTTGPVIGPDGAIYVGTGRSLVAWNDELTTVLFRIPGYRDPLGNASSTPHGVGMIAIDAAEVVHYVSGTTVFAMNPNGTPYWNRQIESPSVAPPTIMRNGHLLVGATNGILYRIGTGSIGLSQSKWPMYQRNARHIGRQGRDAND